MDAPDGHEAGKPSGLKRGPSEPAGGRGSDSSGCEILLVEDNPGDVALFKAAVEESEVRGELSVATSGDAALSMLLDADGPESTRSTDVDLVVLDLDLPGTPGLAVLEELKGDQGTLTTPVLILSTSDDPEDVERAYDLGANAYLVKRMGFSDTVALVEALEAFWFEAAELPE